MALDELFSTLGAMFAPRGRLTIDASPLTVSAGATIRGRITYHTLDRPRLVRALHLHFQLSSTVLRVGSDFHGKPSMQPVTQTHDLVEPQLLCYDLPVPEGSQWSTEYALSVPEGQLMTSIPGQLDYHVVARAAIDGESIGAWANVAVIVVPGAHQSAIAAGASCTALAPGGERRAAMIVEARGAVTLVQWADGSPATWVRSSEVEPA